MNFADILKKKAADDGHQTIEKPKEEVAVTTDTNAFAAALSGHKAKAVEEDSISTDLEVGQVPVWSFSTLKNFEACPHMVYLAKIKREPQKSSDAADRGSLIHEQCEHFIMGTGDFPTGDKRTKFHVFQNDFELLREMYEQGKVSVEEDWGIRADWSPCDWKDPDLWGRAKLDAFVRESETSCRIVDQKTGRRFGNELKHGDQGLSYALHAYHRFPELDHFCVEFWYLDQGEYMKKHFTRAMLTKLLPRYHKRAAAMTTAKKFLAKPNMDACRFCPYGSNCNKKGEQYGTGVCSHDYYLTAN